MERCWSRGPWTALVTALACAGVALGALGCSHGCEQVYACTWEAWNSEEPACPEDPADVPGGEIPADCGVWVSASLGDDGNEGTPSAPLATLSAALERAAMGPGRVYACAEAFEGPFVWPAGVSLHGGFSCDALEWRYAGERTLTRLLAPAGDVPLTLTGSSSPEPSLFTDLWVQAAAASEPGGSSIAVLALPDARAEIRRGKLASREGANGADGGTGGHFGVPAADGLSGNNGAAACTAPVGMGGAMVAIDCGEGTSAGGRGGHAGELQANAGDGGEPAPETNPQGFGLGGAGEDLQAGLFCMPGIGGAAGRDGTPGMGGAWPPRLTAAGYMGVWGEDGEHGRAGQGGGGGGGAAGNAMCGAKPHGGAGGGSGGSGGCGGKGGLGGQPGGASIALATLTDAITLVDCTLETGNGGSGGDGGIPQQGGQGGLPGLGGAGLPVAGGPSPGCAGGAGGYGGDGGDAGGGLGGPSMAVAYVGARQPSLVSCVVTAGLGGHGGKGSDPNITGAAGDDGETWEMEALLP